MTSARVLYLAVRQWLDNQDLRWGAALAYYALFSIAPLLVLAIDIAGFFYGEEAARGRLQQELSGAFDPEAARFIESLLKRTTHEHAGRWAPYVGYVLLVVGALGVFLHLRTALSFIWKLEPPRGGVLATALDYLLALVMVVLIGILLLASLAASVTVTTVQAYLAGHVPLDPRIWQLVELGSSFLLLTLLFAATYRVLSLRRISWSYVWYGSFIAAILFSFGKLLLSYYLVFTGTASAYGAAGSVVAFLVWVYYSSQVLFFGAELIQARRRLTEERLAQ